MECPKCKHTQPDGLEECQQCGVIFARIPKPGVPTTPAEVHNLAYVDEGASSVAVINDTSRPAPVWILAVFIVLLGALTWWLNFPASSAPVKGAYKDEEKGFSVLPPSDWVTISASNYETLLGQFKGRFPVHLQKFLKAPGFAVGFFKIAATENEIPPSLNVISMPLKQPLPPLDEHQREEATKAITGEIARMIDSYQLHSSSIVKVDGQPALQLVSSATIRMVIQPRTAILSEPTAFGRHVTGYTEEIARDVTFKSIQTLLPGKDHAYILTCSYDAADVDISMSTCQLALDSFRVGKRPPRFGSITTGALNGGLLAAIAYLLFMLMGRAFRRD